MIFWILIGIAVVVVVGFTIGMYLEFRDPFDGFMGGFISAIISAIVIGIYTGIVMSIPMPAQDGTPYKYDLKAMSTSTTTEGRISGGIFVTSGYINERQVLSYIRDSGDGGSVLRQAYADRSTIYEGFDDPTVSYVEYTFGNPVLHPFTSKDTRDFVFNVPTGSVSNQIEVTP